MVLFCFSKLIRIHSFLLKPALNGSIGTMIQAAIIEKFMLSQRNRIEVLLYMKKVGSYHIVKLQKESAHFVLCLSSYIFHLSRLSLEFQNYRVNHSSASYYTKETEINFFPSLSCLIKVLLN